MDTLKEIMRLQEQLAKIEEEIKNVELLLNVTIKEYGFDNEKTTDIQNAYLIAGRPQIGRMLFSRYFIKLSPDRIKHLSLIIINKKTVPR